MFTKERFTVLLAQNGIFVALIALIAFFGIVNPRFLSLQNGQSILQQVADLGLVALPLALIIMAGSIDLSVGSVASVSAIIAASTMNATGNWPLGFAAGLAFGVLAGAINGALIAFLKLNPLVVTLGFLSVWGGLALFLVDGATVAGLPEGFRALGSFKALGVPIQIIILILVIVLCWFLLNKRPFGRELLAVGGNERASFLMGVKVNGVRMRLFMLSGFFAALAGIMLAAKLQAAAPTAGLGMEVQALTVVLLGGVAFEGGIGRISGVVLGLLFVGVLRNGLIIAGVSQFLQTILIGLTLVIAVALDSSIQRLVRSNWSRIVKKRQAAA